MSPLKTFISILILFFLSLGLYSAYTIKEGQQGLLLRLGKLEVNATTGKADVKDPGIHFRIPFIEKTQIFDTRLQTLDIKSSRIVTKEKKDVIVDYYVKWRISNLPLYYTRTGGISQRAAFLLQQQLDSGLRAQFGRRTINEAVSDDRSTIMRELLTQANISTTNLGIKIVDVRIKRIDLPQEVSAAVFDRMRAERNRIATEHRSKGKAKATAIRAGADANVTVTLANANAKAAAIRAIGDAKAAKIYAEAYGKDKSFYAFYQSIIAYQNTFNNKKDILILKPNTQFFKYFNNSENKLGK